MKSQNTKILMIRTTEEVLKDHLDAALKKDWQDGNGWIEDLENGKIVAGQQPAN